MTIRGKLTLLCPKTPRSEPRRIVNLAARLKERGTEESDVIVEDISTRGCKLRPCGTAEVDRVVWLKLPGLESIRCRVAWVEADEAGCEFETLIHESQLDFVRSQALMRLRRPVAAFGLKR
ncbi:MAG: PilZ domain-containing protein [Pseudomonadota bacterium]|nr:PilZ domain-containing protein [Pseudomonadota bacterium]